MKLLKGMFLGLLFCWLLVSSPICSAATITLTDQETQQYKLNSAIVEKKLNVLELSLPESSRRLLQVEEKLLKSEARLAQQETLLSQYEATLKETQETLKRLNESLLKTEQLLKQERDAHKKQVDRLKTEKIIWGIVGIAAGAMFHK